MLNSKQRSVLSSAAQSTPAIFQIGKNGVTETFLNEVSNALDARELVKITVLKNSELTAKDVLKELCESLSAEAVSCIGFKITLYRKSKKDIFKSALNAD